MRLRDRILSIRRRLVRAYRAYRGITPRLRRFDDLDEDEQAEFKRQLGQTVEDMNEDMRQALMHKLQEDTEEEVEALNESFRGGNGHD